MIAGVTPGTVRSASVLLLASAPTKAGIEAGESPALAAALAIPLGTSVFALEVMAAAYIAVKIVAAMAREEVVTALAVAMRL